MPKVHKRLPNLAFNCVRGVPPRSNVTQSHPQHRWSEIQDESGTTQSGLAAAASTNRACFAYALGRESSKVSGHPQELELRETLHESDRSSLGLVPCCHWWNRTADRMPVICGRAASESLGEHLNVDSQAPVPSAQRLDSGVWLFVHPARPSPTSLVPEAGTVVWVEAGAVVANPKSNLTAYDAAAGDASNDH